MLIVLVETDAIPAKREEFLALLKTHAETSRAEPGCGAFNLYEDPWTPNRFRLVEEWASQDALGVHFETPHMKRFLEAIPTLTTGEAKVRRFEAEELA